MKALLAVSIYAVFGVVMFGTIGIIYDVVGERWAIKAAALIAVSLVSAGLAVWAGARGNIRLAWSSAWFAALIICVGSGIYFLPAVRRSWLSWNAVETESRYEGVRDANRERPQTPSVRAWVLSHERDMVLAALRWEYEQKMHDAGSGIGAVLCFGIGVFPLLMIVLRRKAIRVALKKDGVIYP